MTELAELKYHAEKYLSDKSYIIPPFILDVIFENTSFLSTKSMMNRMFCIINDITSPPTCAICDNKVKFVNQNGRYTYRTFCCKTCKEQNDQNIRDKRIADFGPIPKCKKCDNLVTFDSGNNKYRTYCSLKCKNKDMNSVMENVRATNKEKYGTEHPQRLQEVKDKAKKTNLKKFGVEWTQQNKEIRQKVKNTNLEKYGNACPMQSDTIKHDIEQKHLKKYGTINPQGNAEVRERTKQNNLKKYGTEYPQRTEAIKIKTKDTNLKKYGTSTPQQLPSRKAKVKETNLKKYGTEFPNSNDEVRQKGIDTSLKKFGTSNPRSSDIVKDAIKQTNIELYNRDSFTQQHIPIEVLDQLNDKEWVYNEHITKQKPLRQIADELNVNETTVGNYAHSHGIDIQRFWQSIGEKEVGEFIQSHNITIKTGNRTIISPYELDIFLPDYNIAIEYCGLYWHSEQQGKHKQYHKRKHDMCKERGIQLLTIYEDEWKKQQTQVCNKILSLCNKLESPTVYARKASITLVSTETKRAFFDANHIQGDGPGSINLGLMYDNELIACMSFIKQKHQHYLNRYATSCSIPGGFSKLLKHFTTNYEWELLISFADQRWSTGKLYESTGWELDSTIPPDYYYSQNGNDRAHKFSYRRKFLPNLLKHFDPELSEWENCKANNVLRIWDCGKLRYVMSNT